MRRAFPLGALTAFIASVGPLAAQPVEPGFRVTRFENWEVVCPTSGESRSAGGSASVPPAGSACKASQRLAADGADTPVFALTLLPNARHPKSFIAIVSLPLGVYLAPGLEVRIDKGKPYKILFETCNQAGCHAGFPLEGPVLTAFRRGRQAEFRVWTGKAKPTPVLVSLTGLAPALTALSEVAR